MEAAHDQFALTGLLGEQNRDAQGVAHGSVQYPPFWLSGDKQADADESKGNFHRDGSPSDDLQVDSVRSSMRGANEERLNSSPHDLLKTRRRSLAGQMVKMKADMNTATTYCWTAWTGSNGSRLAGRRCSERKTLGE